MNNFETNLLREKFTITNKEDGKNTKVIALSNRISCPLHNYKGQLVEELVIRGQNLYSCARMLARIMQAFHVGGSLTARTTPFKWDKVWKSALSDYEEAYNPDRWIAIYHEGKVIFEAGQRHPFVDMIEKCNASLENPPYENALKLAEKAFKQTGKNFEIEHDANVALIINAEDNSVRCGAILRTAHKTTTFSFTTTIPEKDKHTSLAPFISAIAAQTEAVQICFTIGLLSEKDNAGLIEKGSDEAKKLREAKARLGKIQAEIANLETSYKINYRPEKPNFNIMIEQAKTVAGTMVG